MTLFQRRRCPHQQVRNRGGWQPGNFPPEIFKNMFSCQVQHAAFCSHPENSTTVRYNPPTPPPENISWLRPCTPPEMLSTSNNTFSPLARACSRPCVARNDRDACLIKCRDVGHCVALFSFRASTAFRVRCMQTLSVAIS